MFRGRWRWEKKKRHPVFLIRRWFYSPLNGAACNLLFNRSHRHEAAKEATVYGHHSVLNGQIIILLFYSAHYLVDPKTNQHFRPEKKRRRMDTTDTVTWRRRAASQFHYMHYKIKQLVQIQKMTKKKVRWGERKKHSDWINNLRNWLAIYRNCLLDGPLKISLW